MECAIPSYVKHLASDCTRRRIAVKAPSNNPAAVLAGTILTRSPLLEFGAYSAINKEAPAYSPEAENP